jgi:hypothetical protein
MSAFEDEEECYYRVIRYYQYTTISGDIYGNSKPERGYTAVEG